MVEAGNIERPSDEESIEKDLNELAVLIEQSIDTHIEEIKQLLKVDDAAPFQSQFVAFCKVLNKMQQTLLQKLNENQESLFKSSLLAMARSKTTPTPSKPTQW